MKRVLLIFFLSLLFITSCKKYPEGGFVNRGPKNIIGIWKLQLYEVNGIDSTDLINYNNDNSYKKILFQKNASTISISAPNSGASMVDFLENNKKLVFENSKPVPGTECTLYQNVNYCYRSFLIPEGTQSAVWSIDQLNKKQIKLNLSLKNSYKIILSQ